MLEAVLREPERSWTRTQLASAAGQHKKARMDRHLSPLVEAGLLRRTGDAYLLVTDQPIAAALEALLRELALPFNR